MQLSIPPSQMDVPTLILSDSLSEPGIRWPKDYWRRVPTSLHNLTDRGGLTTDPELSVAHGFLLCDATIRPEDERLRTSLSGLVPIPCPFPCPFPFLESWSSTCFLIPSPLIYHDHPSFSSYVLL